MEGEPEGGMELRQDDRGVRGEGGLHGDTNGSLCREQVTVRGVGGKWWLQHLITSGSSIRCTSNLSRRRKIKKIS